MKWSVLFCLFQWGASLSFAADGLDQLLSDSYKEQVDLSAPHQKREPQSARQLKFEKLEPEQVNVKTNIIDAPDKTLRVQEEEALDQSLKGTSDAGRDASSRLPAGKKQDKIRLLLEEVEISDKPLEKH